MDKNKSIEPTTQSIQAQSKYSANLGGLSLSARYFCTSETRNPTIMNAINATHWKIVLKVSAISIKDYFLGLWNMNRVTIKKPIVKGSFSLNAVAMLSIVPFSYSPICFVRYLKNSVLDKKYSQIKNLCMLLRPTTNSLIFQRYFFIVSFISKLKKQSNFFGNFFSKLNTDFFVDYNLPTIGKSHLLWEQGVAGSNPATSTLT